VSAAPPQGRDEPGVDARPSLAVIVVLALAVLAVYGDVLARLSDDWLHDPNYSHGILLPPLAAWLVWRRRAELASLGRQPSHAGAVIVAASLVVFLFGLAAVEFFLTRISLVGVIAGVIVQLAGWQYLRRCWFPLALVSLSIPIPALIYNQVAFPMQLLASQLGAATLDALSVPAVREGNVILLERATLEVAEACSGVRSLISLSTLTFVYGYLGRRSPVAQGVLIFAVLPIVIVANGLRVASAGWVAHAYGTATAAGFLHTSSGWIFFVLAVGLLFAFERVLSAVDWPAGARQPDSMSHA
jgi:exosortase